MAVKVLLYSIIFSVLCQGCCQHVHQIVAMVSTPEPGKEGPSQSWERGLEILPGAQLAVRHIRDSNILGSYSLDLIEIITEGCDVNTALVEFIGHVTQPEQNIVGIVGPFCNDITHAIASLAEYELFHFVQVSPARAQRFEDTNRYQYLYRMLPSLNSYTEAVLGLMDRFNWNKVAVLCGSNEDHYYCRAAESFVLSISDRELIELVFYGEVASEEPSITPTLEYLRESGAKIIVAFLPSHQASHVVSAAYNKGMKWPDYAWILPDHSVDGILSNDSVLTDPEGLFLLQPQLETGDGKFHLISNITYSEYYDELLASGSSPQNNPYANVFHDSVWAIALALNNTVHSLDKNQYNLTERISEELSLLSFPGTLGNVQFNGSHSRTNTTVDIFHIRNRKTQHVGYYNHVSGTVVNISLFNDIPSDELEKHYILFSTALTWTVSSIVASCLLFITAMLFLYLYYRKEPEIKATSTHLSLLTFLGCYLMCISALLDAIFDGTKVPISMGAVFCCTLTWGNAIGSALTLATLLVKLLRIYRVFTLFRKTGKVYSDASLVVMVLLLVSGLVIILTVWTVVDTHRLAYSETFNSESTPPRLDYKLYCYSTYIDIWIGISAVYYTTVFLVPLLFLAFKTRKVWRSNFKDTKKVVALVFAILFLWCFGVPLWIFLEHPVLKDLVVTFCYTAVAMVTQLFLIVPKVAPPLGRCLQAKP